MISRRIHKKKRKHSRKRKNTYRRRTHRGGQVQVKTYSFYNRFHYGDNILNLKFFYNISDILKANNIQIKYYYDDVYIKNPIELERYVNKDTVTLDILPNKPADAIELWMGNSVKINNDTIHYHGGLNTYYDAYYKNILLIMNLQDKNIDTSLFQNEPYLQNIYNNLDPKYHNLDILFNNSPPVTVAGVVKFNKEKLDAYCIKLSKKYNIAVTEPIENTDIKSTRKDGLTLQDIGAISTHTKYIITPSSGPLIPCYNTDTKAYVKKWILFGPISDNIYKQISPVVIESYDELDKVDQYLT